MSRCIWLKRGPHPVLCMAVEDGVHLVARGCSCQGWVHLVEEESSSCSVLHCQGDAFG